MAGMADNEEPVWAKIDFRQNVDDLVQYGPSLKVGISADPFVGGEMASACSQIDTGAAGTGISTRLAERLGLVAIDHGELHHPGGDPIVAPAFKVRLYLPGAELNLEVIGLSTLDPPHDVLIGRDVLASCRLVVDFSRGMVGLDIKAS